MAARRAGSGPTAGASRGDGVKGRVASLVDPLTAKLVAVARRRGVVTYGELAEELGTIPRVVPQALKVIQDRCRQEHVPDLTAVVVAKATARPSPGFFAPYGGDEDRWRGLLDAVHAHRWPDWPCEGDRSLPDAPSPVVAEFTHQAQAFAVAPVMHAAVALADFLALLPAAGGQRWCDVACGPGILARALAPRVAEVVGVDLTPAMVDTARAEARREAVANVRFLQGDATALPFADGAFDGAMTRFSLHHIPAPGRVVAEMARVVRPGGTVAVVDHLTSANGAAAAWHQEIERLRDPSHWANLAPDALRGIGDAAGLTLVAERTLPFDLDWEEWIGRGSGGPGNRALIERLVASAPPDGDEVFALRGGRLWLRLGVAVWRRDA